MTLRPSLRLVPLLVALVAQGCAPNKPPVQDAGPNVLDEGRAKACTPSAVEAGAATIAMSNDGWCGITLSEADGRPFSYGLVRSRPAHGRVYVQPYGTQTRIEYTPGPGFSGTDSFTVALRSRTPGVADPVVRVAVNVAPGDTPVFTPAAATPTPAPTRREPARTPARRPAQRNAR